MSELIEQAKFQINRFGHTSKGTSLALVNTILAMAKLLCVVAYPRYGTEEMDYSREELAKIIQDKFSLDEIDADRD